MDVNSINSYSNTTSLTGNNEKEFNSSLDKDAFLNLLVTQLRYQNPLEPMKDTDFIAQMAQFTSLEQAKNTNKVAKINSAYGMVGKYVKATISDESGNLKAIEGIVESVQIENDEAFLIVDSQQIPYESVNEITDLMNNAEQYRLTIQNMRLNMAYSMLGREIKAIKDNEEISGKVDAIRSENGIIKIIVGENELTVDDIYEIK